MNTAIDTCAEIDYLIVQIEKAINSLLNSVLHHPEFQRLESCWSGVRMLTEAASVYQHEDEIRVDLLAVSKNELEEAFEFTEEVHRSRLYNLIYSRAFNTPGGNPFSVLLVDIEITSSTSDYHLLTQLSRIGAVSFCPVILGVAPSFFRVDAFEQLYGTARSYDRYEKGNPLQALFESSSYAVWRTMRTTYEASFIGLVLPRVLLRPVYDYRQQIGTGAFRHPDALQFPFVERISMRSDRLWGTAVYAFGATLIDCFARSGWLADIHGVPVLPDSAGIVPNLQVEPDSVDISPVVPKSATDAIVSDQLEGRLSEMGFIPLSHRHHTQYAAFCSTQSFAIPPEFSEDEVTTSESMSSKLQCTLCMCRFAHYIKHIGHAMIGGTSPEKCEEEIRRFLVDKYVLDDENAKKEDKAAKPLNRASVQLHPAPRKVGHYLCQIMLKPHAELDAIAVRFSTELVVNVGNQ